MFNYLHVVVLKHTIDNIRHKDSQKANDEHRFVTNETNLYFGGEFAYAPLCEPYHLITKNYLIKLDLIINT